MADPGGEAASEYHNCQQQCDQTHRQGKCGTGYSRGARPKRQRRTAHSGGQQRGSLGQVGPTAAAGDAVKQMKMHTQTQPNRQRPMRQQQKVLIPLWITAVTGHNHCFPLTPLLGIRFDPLAHPSAFPYIPLYY